MRRAAGPTDHVEASDGVLTADRPMTGALDLVRRGLARCGMVTVPVRGDSMLPTLRSGERVVLHAIKPGQVLRPQDVVAFGTAEGVLVIHRVHDIGQDRILTAGDGLAFFDAPITPADVVGIVRGLAASPVPCPWPDAPAASSVDVWVIDADTQDCPVPAGWRLRRRAREGVGVSDAVLEELRAAVRQRPCVAVSERAVHAAGDVLTAGLPAGTQVLVGCSFGRLRHPMPGNLVPTEFADVHVRVGPPGVPLSPLETVRRFAALVAEDAVETGRRP